MIDDDPSVPPAGPEDPAPPRAEAGPAWVRCLTSHAIVLTDGSGAEDLWPGKVIDRERELRRGLTIREAMAGIDGWCEPCGDPRRGDDIGDEPKE